ncbi:uncharacterized protein LOC107620806 [Arachis ipaensis]|uniref:uncharacterized protein LOC107620806 n=1 Tax=Arachis ipaensis TaxID=130454 RepID=UPI0007AF9A12|nr:uncharacterized protein LOC107620806 [Arachis ipaensis]XP_025685267.1 uncharacterized protein LOC112786059 [Arachis hypogaea]
MLEIFYNDLSEMSKMSLDHSDGGSLHMKKMHEEAQEFIDIVANNQYMYTSKRSHVNNGAAQKRGVMEGWRNHANFGWRDQQRPQQGFSNNQSGTNQNMFHNRPFEPSQQQKEIPKQSLSDLATIVSNFSKTTPSFMTEIRSSNRNLEIQVGQLSKKIPEIPSNTLPSNTKVNPKEECKALTMEREEPEEYPSLDEQEETKEEKIARFLAILKKLKADSSYAEALEKEPPSMACLKASRENEIVVLTKERSALDQKKLPQKLPNPGSFLIPYTIGTITFEKPTKISLEMEDKSLKRAYGMAEDVLVKVEDLYIPANFVILDTGEDKDDSIILRRPFLATAKALIDVKK